MGLMPQAIQSTVSIHTNREHGDTMGPYPYLLRNLEASLCTRRIHNHLLETRIHHLLLDLRFRRTRVDEHNRILFPPIHLVRISEK